MNPSKFVLTKAFWNKEKPEGLKKSDKPFVAAIDAYNSALDSLKKPSDSTLKGFDDAEGKLKSAANAVIAEADKLGAQYKKDKKKKEPYDSTVTALKKSFVKILADNRKTYDQAKAGLNGAGDDPFASNDAHTAYLKGEVSKLRRRELKFCLALTSNKPSEMRFNFSPSKGGRALVGPIKKSCTVKKFTFGTAMAASIAEGVEEDEAKARTLVLKLEGKRIPGLAKRVKLMLRQLGISSFNLVKIMEDGKDIDSADDTADDSLAEIDLSVADPDVDAADGQDGDPTPAPSTDGGGSVTQGVPVSQTPPPVSPEPATAPPTSPPADTPPTDAPPADAPPTAPDTPRGDTPPTAPASPDPNTPVQIAKQKGAIAGSKLPKTDRRTLLAKLGNDGTKLKAASDELTKIAAANVPPGRMLAMLELKDTNPAAYAELLKIAVAGKSKPANASQAASTALSRKMARIKAKADPYLHRWRQQGPVIDKQKAVLGKKKTALTNAAAKLATEKTALTNAIAARDAAKTKYLAAAKDYKAKRAAARKAEREMERFLKTLPKDWSDVSFAQRMERHRLAVRWGMLQNFADMSKASFETAKAEYVTAKGKHSTAKVRTKQAKRAHAGAKRAHVAQTAKVKRLEKARERTGKKWVKLDSKREAVGAKRKEIEDRRAVFDAVSHGPLSAAGLKPPLPPDKVESFLKEYQRDPALGRQVLKLMQGAKNPADLVTAMPTLINLKAGGFKPTAAPPPGKTHPSFNAKAMDKMTLGALQLVAQQGPGVATKIKAYYDAGKHVDSAGNFRTVDGLPLNMAPDKKKVALGRTKTMAAALLDSTGKVNLGGTGDAAAQAQKKKVDDTLADLMFHPSALLTPTPDVNAQIQSTLKLLSDPATAATAKAKIDGVGAATDPTVKNLVKKSLDLSTDPDAAQTRTAVLSAMMTPIQQGKAGSCFSTGPIRALRQSDPMKVLDGITELTKTGKFTPGKGPKVPAVKVDAQLPGDNPLLKSYEYSVTAAAANLKDSKEYKRLLRGMFDGNATGGKDFDELASVVGAKWSASYREGGTLKKSKRDQLKIAIQKDITYTYNAKIADKGGSGDGSSTHGVYQLVYKDGTVLDTEAKFVAKVIEIALATLGIARRSPDGQKVIDLVSSAAFRKNLLKAYHRSSNKGTPYSPWNQEAGGWGEQTREAITGTKETPTSFIPKKAAATSPNDRAVKLLSGLLTATAGVSGSIPLDTSGKGANHVFNALPDHPDMQKLRQGGDIAKNIKEQLTDPGTALASTDLTLSASRDAFERILKGLVSAFTSPAVGVISKVMRKPPNKAMNPKDLAKHIQKELKPFVKAHVKFLTKEWKKAQRKAGKPSSGAALTEKIKKFTEDTQKAVRDGISGDFANTLPVPQAVIADTNWGSTDGQTYFVMAPDPSTGDLRLWKKVEPGGKLRPADSYQNANWSTIR